MLTNKKIPKKAHELHFRSLDNKDVGILNLCCYRSEIKKIKNYNKKLDFPKKIYIYYPIFDKFYVQEHYTGENFTFNKLIKLIYDTGINAGKYEIKHNPEFYKNNWAIVPTSFVTKYAISSNNKRSDIKILDNNIYISLQD